MMNAKAQDAYQQFCDVELKGITHTATATRKAFEEGMRYRGEIGRIDATESYFIGLTLEEAKSNLTVGIKLIPYKMDNKFSRIGSVIVDDEMKIVALFAGIITEVNPSAPTTDTQHQCSVP
jgi:hypothetical protein